MLEIIKYSLETCSKIRDTCWQVILEAKGGNPKLSNFAHTHFYYYSERCQSLNILLQDGKLWDCEILMRPALECITRLIFVCIAVEQEQVKRIREFEVDLMQVNAISISEKAKKAAFYKASDPVGAALTGGAAISEVELEELRKIWPKKKRQELNQKWSFSEMAREISQFKSHKLDLTGFPALLHSYGIGSHLIHADRTATILVWDRNHREKGVFDLMTRAHAAGLLSTQNILLWLGLKAVAAAANIELNSTDIDRRIAHLVGMNDRYQKEFYQSQSHLYES